MEVDILFITHNRLPYVSKTLPKLLENQEEFQIFWWDNHSTDGTRDFVCSIDDPRIVKKKLSPKNLLQNTPTRWFLKNSRAQAIGKVDDDTLVPKEWINNIGSLVAQHKQVGMIGCWTFWPEDFQNYQENIIKEVVRIGGHQIIQDTTIGGSAFLMDREHALHYLLPESGGYEFPVDRLRMSLDGLISGWYYPILWAEHMDDPRSQYCLMNKNMKDNRALTARARDIRTPQDYLKWIKDDAHYRFTHTYQRKLKSMRWNCSLLKKVLNKIRRLWRKPANHP